MRTYIVKFLFLCVFVFSGNSYAEEYRVACVEGAPNGWAHCRLKPDAFDGWVWDSGYGVAPRVTIDGRNGYSSLDQAVYEAMNYLVADSKLKCNTCHPVRSADAQP
ncbi:hypothetical protein, partial [Acidovorax sp. Root217]|uniref:hypothetical protein n=1 Tax=Acidovorax sp. Root217 TaxID=1736492 RepID=UPI001F46960E